MKIKHSLKAVMLFFISALVLAGCGQNKSNDNNSSTSSHKVSKTAANSKKAKKRESTSSLSSQESKKALWNDHKDDLLTQFINQWAPKMNQKYTKYDGKSPLKASTGTFYPDDLTKAKVNGNKTTIGMSKDGKGNNEYNVVAIYNYNGTEPPLPNHITYVFAFHDNQPVALVDQSRDGDPELKVTQNTDVQSNFKQIVDNNSFAKQNNDNSTSSSTDTDKKESDSEVEPLTLEEGLSLIKKAGGEVPSQDSKIISSNGSTIVIGGYIGAKGYDKITVKPNANGEVSIHEEKGTLESGSYEAFDGADEDYTTTR